MPNPLGRPTDFRESFGEEIIQLMSTGLSLTAASAELGFHRQRVYEWIERHPDFADAIKLAKGKRLLKLEKDLLNEDMPSPAITARIFALKNADPEEWTDKQIQQQEGPNGGPQQHEVTHKMPDEVFKLLQENSAARSE